MSNANRRWGTAIRRRLDAWGWTQTRMAEYLDESPQRINDWLRFRRVPNDAAKTKLVERLMLDPVEVAPDWMRAALERSAQVPPAPVMQKAA